jgi:phosphoenolpyruvate---glycerone phosphotransferase subunit DhaK
MKKLMNAAETLGADALAGFVAANRDVVALGEGFVTRAVPDRAKVALVSGGGAGHEPLHVGFVGRGMLDAAVPGAVFTSPTPDRILAAAEAVAGDAGVLFIVKNYEGDVMNFEMAAEMLAIPSARVLVDDDIAIDTTTSRVGRRGVAGTLVVEKVVGAAAEAGADLDTCRRIGERVVARTRSMGVALGSCTVPVAGRPTFSLAEDEMEMGVGIHGEPGRERMKLAPLDAIARQLVDAVVAGLGSEGEKRALLFVNGFGGTPAIELWAVYGAAAKVLEAHGFTIERTLVGNWVTSLEMAGCSITITRLDDEIRTLWDAPALTGAFVRAG